MVHTLQEYEKELGRPVTTAEFEIAKKIAEAGYEDEKHCPCSYGICEECTIG